MGPRVQVQRLITSIDGLFADLLWKPDASIMAFMDYSEQEAVGAFQRCSRRANDAYPPSRSSVSYSRFIPWEH